MGSNVSSRLTSTVYRSVATILHEVKYYLAYAYQLEIPDPPLGGYRENVIFAFTLNMEAKSSTGEGIVGPVCGRAVCRWTT